MSQHDLVGGANPTRTMIGLGISGESRGGPGVREMALAGPDWFVKRLDWGRGLGAPVVREFTRQALGVARLRHPHIVQVVDAGSAPDGTPFAVMERLSGATLEERAGGSLIPLAELIPILRGVASGLAAAHAAGVAHRELRADNVFMADAAGYAYGFPKLLDFGVAELTAGACARGRDLPDLAFEALPPEQRIDVAGGDATSDQYALAALAYRFLAVAELTPALELVLVRAMAWHPARRFDSMTALLEALEAATRASLQASPTPAPALEAGSLTQQFFADGERLERAAEQAQAASTSAPRVAKAAVPADAGDDTLSLPERVPRSRASMIVALSLALGSTVVVGWTAVELSEAPRWSGPVSVEASRAASPAVAVAATPPGAATRTASMALRALPRTKAAAPASLPPTEPPPVAAPPAAPSPTAAASAAGPATPPPSPVVEAPVATVATPPTAAVEPNAAAAAPATPGGGEVVTQAPPERTEDQPSEAAPSPETPPSEPAIPQNP